MTLIFFLLPFAVLCSWELLWKRCDFCPFCLPALCLGLEQGEAEGDICWLGDILWTLDHYGQNCLWRPEEKVLTGSQKTGARQGGSRENAKTKIGTQKLSQDPPKLVFSFFFICSELSGTWSQDVESCLSPMSFTYAGCNLKSRKNQPVWAKYPLSLSDHHSKVGQHGIKGAFPPERSNNALGKKGFKMFF